MRFLIVLALALFCSACATKYTPPVAFKYFLIEASETTRLDVVCDGKVAYTVELDAGVPVEIGGPEALCTFVPDQPVELELDPVWETEGAE